MAALTRFRAEGCTDPGQARERNEDRIHYDPDRGIFFVVDGMGGHAGGERAAEIARDVLRRRLERQTDAIEDRIREAIALANNAIYSEAAASAELRGMGCVLTVVVLDNGIATAGHVGDTRLYEIRHGRIRKLTRDHSPVGQREDSGELTEAEAMAHPRRNEVFRDVGLAPRDPQDEDFIDLLKFPFEPDSALLLCSDGLSDLVPAARIADIVQEHAGDPAGVARALVNEANERGGKDNISVVYIEGDRFRPVTPQRIQAPEAVATTAPETPYVSEQATQSSGWTNVLWLLVGLALGAGLLLLAQSLFPAIFAADGRDRPREPKTILVGHAPGRSASLADALAAAGAGDTIQVAPGTYSGSFDLRDGVNLVSEQPGAAVLAAPAEGAEAIVTARGLKAGRLSGFTIDASRTPVALRLIDADLLIFDNEIRGATVAAIEASGATRATLVGNRIWDNAGVPLVAREQAGPVLRSNLLRISSASGARTAIDVIAPARPVLEGNSVEGDLRWELPAAERETLSSRNRIGLGVRPTSIPKPRAAR